MEGDTSELLIASVEKNPVLWQKSHQLFKDTKKQDVWKVLGDQIGIGGE